MSTMHGLPRGYDQWRTASPFDREDPLCVCGHSADDHEDIKDPHGHLDLIRRLSDKLAYHFSEFTITGDGKAMRVLLAEADEALASCQVAECHCREFIEAEPDDMMDYEPEFDEVAE